MGTAITQVDAFTAEPFAGNPAAVCLLSRARDERWMQAVAREMNLSETAFLAPRGDAQEGGEGGFDLRWFTPLVEVDLCGHATLASAHVLWEQKQLPPSRIAKFYTRSGVLTAAKQGDWIEMDFPANPAEPIEPSRELEAALGIEAKSMGRSRFDYLVEVATEDEVRQAKPDFSALRKLPVRGAMITSRAFGSEYDFVSRFFAPAVGVDEDPVTGSAHCCLAPFWASRLGRQSLTGYQASARGGFVRVRCAGNRVLLSGQAVTVMRCELF